MKKKKTIKKKVKKKEKSGLFGSLNPDENIPLPPGISLEDPKKKINKIGKFRFEKGEIVELEAIGAKIKFINHSHKRVRRGQTSPLLCSFTIELKGESPVDARYSLHPKRNKHFTTEHDESKRLYFEIVKYSYGDFMEMKVSVEESFFEEQRKMKRENEEFKKSVSILPYRLSLLIIELHELEFHEGYKKKDMSKLFSGYFDTDFTRKIFHIFTSVKYQQWIDRKYMPFKGIKNLNHHYSQGLKWNEEKLKEMKSLKSIRHFFVDNLDSWKVLLGGDIPTLQKLLDVTLGKIVPFEQMIQTLNESKNPLEEVEIDVNLSTADYENLKKEDSPVTLQISHLRVLKLSRFPLENIFSKNKVMKNLRIIKITEWKVSGDQLESILVNTRLRKLELVSCNLEVIDSGFLERIFNLPDLRHLSFAYSKNFDKSSFRVMINEFSKLEILELQQSTGTGIGQAFMECLCNKLANLKEVDFTKNRLTSDCSNVMLSENCVWKNKSTKIIVGYRNDHENGFDIQGLSEKFDVQRFRGYP